MMARINEDGEKEKGHMRAHEKRCKQVAHLSNNLDRLLLGRSGLRTRCVCRGRSSLGAIDVPSGSVDVIALLSSNKVKRCQCLVEHEASNLQLSSRQPQPSLGQRCIVSHECGHTAAEAIALLDAV